MQNISSPDMIVIGAGIFGLWAARHAILRGERVLVLEKRAVGAGASGGFLGALMPHMPDTWNAKKQMQFDGLASLGEAIMALEADTGLDCGFRRCGRLMPMTHEKMTGHAKARVDGADTHWRHQNGETFEMTYLPPGFKGTIAEGWLSEAAAPFGATYDTLSARVNPRAYLRTLAAFVRSASHGLGGICEGADVVSVSDTQKDVAVRLADGTVISASRVVIANGWEAYGLLGKMGAKVRGQPVSGRGVKGQAVLLDVSHEDDRPILYDNGSYIVPHGVMAGVDEQGRANRVAVGSTSVNDWMPLGLGGSAGTASGAGPLEKPLSADHLERPASVEPLVNRAGFDDGPLPNFSEMPELVDRVIQNQLSVPSESFVGALEPTDPLAAKLVEAARISFDECNTTFLDHALTLCPALKNAPIARRWVNIRPRNIMSDPLTGKIGTEPVFGPLDDDQRILVAIGGFKISFGLGHFVGFTSEIPRVRN